MSRKQMTLRDNARKHIVHKSDTMLITCGATNKIMRTKLLKCKFTRVCSGSIHEVIIKRLIMSNYFELEWVTILFIELGHCP